MLFMATKKLPGQSSGFLKCSVPVHADHALWAAINMREAPSTHFHKLFIVFFIVLLSINGYPSN